MKDKLGIGVIGCGMISKVYMTNCKDVLKNVHVVSCADINPEAAKRRAEEFGCIAEDVDSLLSNPDVDVVLNLTTPLSHSEITMKSLRHGKHVYSEKPFGVDYEEAKDIVAYAEQNGLCVGGAPDCFLANGMQEVASLIKSGSIGKPFAVQAFMFSKGADSFHPFPEFFYKKGAGPIFDWGPYYISALVSLLGGVETVIAYGKITREERSVQCLESPIYGSSFRVDVPTYVTSILKLRSGVIATISLSFDMYDDYTKQNFPYMRIYGTKSSIDIPDPNMYAGSISEKPDPSSIYENRRGIGLDEMADAILHGKTYRTNAAFVLHVTEVLCAIQQSCLDGKEKIIQSEI